MTVPVILFILFGAAIADLALFYFGGNDSTISRTLLGKDATMPSMSFNVSYTFGLLMGHLFLISQSDESSLCSLIARLFAAFSPILIGIFMIAKLQDAPDSKIIHVLNHPIMTLSFIISGFLVGIAAGHYLVPQHVKG